MEASKRLALTACCPFRAGAANHCSRVISNRGTERQVETWSEDILAIQATCFFCAQQLVRAAEQLRGGTGGAVCAVKGQVTVRGEGEHGIFRNTLWFESDYCPQTPLPGGILPAASNFDFF